MEKIELDIVCESCGGTGVYSGMGERRGAAIICYICKGTGKQKYSFEYEIFNERKKTDKVTRVYKNSYGYCIAPDIVIEFGENKIPVDMAKEGVSYGEFLEGKEPQHIRQIACPMVADQGACHDLSVDFIGKRGCPFGIMLTKCEKQQQKNKCWEEFDELKKGIL